MDLQNLKTRLLVGITAINKALPFDKVGAYQLIKDYYQSCIDKIDNNEQLMSEDISKADAGGRILYEAPLANQQLMDEIIDDINPITIYIDEEYWQKQNDNLA